MHQSGFQVAAELAACIRCNECLAACPALATPLAIETLNRETLDGPSSAPVVAFAQSCYLCGACVPVCPTGLHRDAMMLWLKARLLSN
jgi:ferredoxin